MSFLEEEDVLNLNSLPLNKFSDGRGRKVGDFWRGDDDDDGGALPVSWPALSQIIRVLPENESREFMLLENS